MGSHEPVIAFATRTFEPPALEIRVNFGMFAGREATPAEIDDLAAVMMGTAGTLSIRFVLPIMGAVYDTKKIEVAGGDLPGDEHDLDEFRGRLIETAERWAQECIAERHGEVSDA